MLFKNFKFPRIIFLLVDTWKRDTFWNIKPTVKCKNWHQQLQFFFFFSLPYLFPLLLVGKIPDEFCEELRNEPSCKTVREREKKLWTARIEYFRVINQHNTLVDIRSSKHYQREGRCLYCFGMFQSTKNEIKVYSINVIIKLLVNNWKASINPGSKQQSIDNILMDCIQHRCPMSRYFKSKDSVG